MGTLVALALLLPAPFGGWAARSHAPLPPITTVVDGLCPAPLPLPAPCAQGETLYVPVSMGRSIFYHEVGHAYDYAEMNDAERAAFAAIFRRRYDSVTYWAGASRNRSLAEWFAEGYRLCSLYTRFRDPIIYHVDNLSYDYEPSAHQQREVCKLIRHAAAGSPGRS